MRIIVAPHPDDEIIGCWQLLRTGLIDKVVFFNYVDRCEEARASANKFGFEPVFLKSSSETATKTIADILSKASTVYVPHPYDHHPHHRAVRLLVELLTAKLENLRVMYYSTDMNVPWAIVALGEEAYKKFEDLMECYPSQAEEFRINRYWWLFEGVTPYPSPPTVHVELPFYGHHKYSGAPEHRKYLKYLHPHVFTVKVDMAVAHLNRAVEFHDLRSKLNEIVATKPFNVDSSTEEMAFIIWKKLKCFYPTDIRVCVCEEGNLCGCYGDPLW